MMDTEGERDQQRILNMNNKYNTGRKNMGGQAYNVITLDYERSGEGSKLKDKDDDMKMRHLLRSKNIDTRANSSYNILTGICIR